MKQFRSFAGALIAVALGAIAVPAAATIVALPPPSGASYTIDLPKYAVTDIVIVNLGYPFTTFAQGASGSPLTAATPGPTTLTVTYLTAADLGMPGFKYYPGDSFLLGVTSNLPNNPPGSQDLVVFANNAWASSAQDIAFGTLFPGTNETTLINDLVNQDNPGDIFAFASGDAVSGPNGTIAFDPGQAFTAVAFSNGQTIGTGTSAFIAVPEPATWAMMLMGIFGLGAVMRNARRNQLGAALAV